jgi:membrane protein required for colicin V production
MLPIDLIFNVLVLGALGWGAYQGYRTGLLSEIVSLLHFLIAFGVSILLLKFVFNFLGNYFFKFDSELFAEVVVASSVGLAMVILSTAGKYLKTEIEYDFPGAWDNIIGAIFGILKYVFMLSFFFWFTNAFGSFDEKITSQGATKRGGAFTYTIIEPLSYSIFGYNDHQALSKGIRDFVGTIRPN